MNANTFGHLFQVSGFGESHGVAMGALIHGCPAGVSFDESILKHNLQRRRPGQSAVTTQRNESDEAQVLSGVFEGRTLGTPIAVAVFNQDQNSSSYHSENLKMRKGHATDLWQSKFGHSDFRGSGRASGRETLSRVIGGSVAQMALREIHPSLRIFGFVSQVGSLQLSPDQVMSLSHQIQSQEVNPDQFVTRLPDKDMDRKVQESLVQAREVGESYGGVVDLFITQPPQGLGQPVFKKLKSELASAFLSVGATNSIEVGFAHQQRETLGTEFHESSFSYGGIRGGLSTGEPIHLRIGFKPPSTLDKMAKEGRHDPCILPRAVPVLESMAWMVMMDQVLWARLDRIQ